MPTATMPMESVMRKTLVTLLGSTSLSATFFCVTRHTESLPRTPTVVSPLHVDAALVQYSVKAKAGRAVRTGGGEKRGCGASRGRGVEVRAPAKSAPLRGRRVGGAVRVQVVAALLDAPS